MLYELVNLRKTFERRTVLDLENLLFEKGKILGLLGPNGAGKTTLLEIMAFLSSPTSGEIRFNGEKVDFAGGKLIDLRRKVVLVHQDAILFSTSVSKNVDLPLRIRKVSKARRERVVEELLDLVGMRVFRHSKAHKLSSGETQRVAIARALACSPEVILLDEPTANVDVEHQIAIERIIQEINRTKGISVIFTTHNMIQASRLTDETIFLYDGRVAQAIYENIFSGHIQTDQSGRKLCMVQNELSLLVQSQKSGSVRITIDPSAVRISQNGNHFPTDNTFEGRLIQLTHEHRRVRALVDVGVPLSVLIPRDVFSNLHLGVGDNVWLNCPGESIEIF